MRLSPSSWSPIPKARARRHYRHAADLFARTGLAAHRETALNEAANLR